MSHHLTVQPRLLRLYHCLRRTHAVHAQDALTSRRRDDGEGSEEATENKRDKVSPLALMMCSSCSSCASKLTPFAGIARLSVSDQIHFVFPGTRSTVSHEEWTSRTSPTSLTLTSPSLWTPMYIESGGRSSFIKASWLPG